MIGPRDVLWAFRRSVDRPETKPIPFPIEPNGNLCGLWKDFMISRNEADPVPNRTQWQSLRAFAGFRALPKRSQSPSQSNPMAICAGVGRISGSAGIKPSFRLRSHCPSVKNLSSAANPRAWQPRSAARCQLFRFLPESIVPGKYVHSKSLFCGKDRSRRNGFVDWTLVQLAVR